jgi:WD40 repeat protein
MTPLVPVDVKRSRFGAERPPCFDDRRSRRGRRRASRLVDAPCSARGSRDTWQRALRLVSVVLAIAAGIGAAAPPAAAFYGNGAELVSADFARLEQGDDSTQFAAIAADGRYVAIQTFARNLFPDGDADPPGEYRQGGLFRFDLETRRIELIADGDFKPEADPSATLVRGAKNPSISADGRYVAFSTAQQLVPADVNGNLDVYVRDMDVPIRQQGAFELISAKDGGDVPATYEPGPAAPGLNPGADVTRGSAISADGTKVVFRTDLASDLPVPGAAAGQLLVRDRVAKTTVLVTRTADTGAPAGGASGPAAISADGTTVVWTGANAPAQTRFVDGESLDPAFFYYLWRRVADGPAAPTRRVTGMADPEDPGCPPGSSVVFTTTATGPCFGPLTGFELGQDGSLAAAISGDGDTVAFLTNAGPRPIVTAGIRLDLYVARMDAGLPRKNATIELTREGDISDAEASSPIDSVAMSRDGRWLAIGSSRTRFLLPALQLAGTARLVPNTRDVYAIDLQSRTIERVTRSTSGGDINGSVSSEPTLSGDGSRIAFASFAGNLFFGDANERQDAFVATRQPAPPPTPGGGGTPKSTGQDVTEDLGGDELVLPTSVRRLRGGKLELRIRVPAPGTVTVTARGKVVVANRRTATRVLARANRFSPKAGRVPVVLAVVRRYKPQLQRLKKLAARVEISFSPSRGGRRLHRNLRVVFRTDLKRRKAKRSAIGERVEKFWQPSGNRVVGLW